MPNQSDNIGFHRVLESFQDERFFIFQLTAPSKILMWLLMTGSMIIGSSAKMAIYFQIIKTKLADQPINILIFTENLLNHLSNVFTLVSLSSSFMLGYTVREMVEASGLLSGNSYCWIFFYNSTFMVSYSATNGLCIAIVRLLYIKKGSWLRYDFGEMRMIRITVVSSMAASALLTIMYGHEISSNRSAYNLCMGHSHEYQVKLAVP